jgi:hypothetical protein
VREKFNDNNKREKRGYKKILKKTKKMKEVRRNVSRKKDLNIYIWSESIVFREPKWLVCLSFKFLIQARYE